MAIHTTNLALARSRGAATDAMPQAAWHMAIQAQFLDWLAAGGFADEPAQNENSGQEAAVLMPHDEA